VIIDLKVRGAPDGSSEALRRIVIMDKDSTAGGADRVSASGQPEPAGAPAPATQPIGPPVTAPAPQVAVPAPPPSATPYGPVAGVAPAHGNRRALAIFGAVVGAFLLLGAGFGGGLLVGHAFSGWGNHDGRFQTYERSGNGMMGGGLRGNNGPQYQQRLPGPRSFQGQPAQPRQQSPSPSPTS
jgi:hypothetical protein